MHCTAAAVVVVVVVVVLVGDADADAAAALVFQNLSAFSSLALTRMFGMDG